MISNHCKSWKEVESGCIKSLAQYLGPEWTFVARVADYPDAAIATKHPVWLHTATQTNWTVGVKGGPFSPLPFNPQFYSPRPPSTT